MDKLENVMDDLKQYTSIGNGDYNFMEGFEVNGEYEPFFGNPAECWYNLINKHMGLQAAQAFCDLLLEMMYKFEGNDGEDWELEADERLQELMSATDEIESARDDLRDILDADRLSRQKLEKLYNDLRQMAHNIRFNT